MSDSPVRLVLFDIDGTLVQTGQAGLRGLNAVFERLYQHKGALDRVSLGGRTDRAIIGEVFASMGRHGAADDDEEVFKVREAYLEALALEILKPSPHPFGVLPGVGPLLDALDAESSATVALLTGNFEGGAAIKLGHFDLWRRFAFGAFGDRHVNRRDLVPIALDQARTGGRRGCGRLGRYVLCRGLRHGGSRGMRRNGRWKSDEAGSLVTAAMKLQPR
jgi:phosphoglycolate phosphatase-like HAD superfamily hydrolase